MKMNTKITTVHKIIIVATCPHGGTDVYEAEFRVNDDVIKVEAIGDAIAEATALPIYQEHLTRRLAAELGCVVITSGSHGQFSTACRADPIP